MCEGLPSSESCVLLQGKCQPGLRVWRWTLQVLALDVRLQGAYSGLTPANLPLHLSLSNTWHWNLAPACRQTC